MTEQNRPPHDQDPAQDPGQDPTYPPQDNVRDDGAYDATYGSGYGDGYGDGHDDAYDDAYAYTAQDTATGALGGAGMAGAGGPGGPGGHGAHEAFDFGEGQGEREAQEPLEKSGPPLRGLAMILTAIAVVLIIWGAWSLFSGDDKDDNAVAPSATAPATAPAAGASSVAGGEITPEAPASSEVPTEDPAVGAGAVNRATTRVVVLNNSANDPIAGPTAEQLRTNGWASTGYGNLSGRVEGISEQSRVYYPEGDASAQAAAEQIGAELGLPVAAGNADYYGRFGEAAIREGSGADSVVVVLTGAAG